MQIKHIATVAGLALLVGLALALPQLAGDADSGVEANQINDVWVFRHDSAAGEDALHTGAAEIVDDCLLVDGAVVVWQDHQLDEVEETIQAVRSGESPSLSVAGGGISSSEGNLALPQVVTDRCDVDEVWFATS